VAEWAAVDEGPDRTRPHAASGGAASSFNAQQLADAAGGELIAAGSAPISGAAVDSRRVKSGNVFFALPGERSDGHHFLEAAAAAGAGALVVTEPLPEERLHALASNGRVSIVRVADAGAALRSTAARYRDRFDPLVVGITGSIAKTSTKEQVAEVLDERFTVLRNPANWNNEIGLPMTLLQLRPEHEVAVLEMGLYTTGEIAMLAGLARPSVGVVTAVRGVHLSRAGSIDAIEAGKRELVEALPASGWAVLNADDERVRRMADHTPAQVLTYGFSPAADVGAQDIESLGAAGMRYSLRLLGGTCRVTSPVLGRHGVHNALAAAAVASCIGMDAEAIVAGLARELHMPHRSQLVTAGDWTILDDSYNASPDAVLAALGLLAELPGRRIAVLGEMLELGDDAEAEHDRVGRHAADVADRLVVVGEGARGIVEGALAAGLDVVDVELVDDRDAALMLLLAQLRDGDTILVKASRGAALDLLVDRLVLAAGSGEGTA
jgi:UDP-N-acetylmuramoyl-tripeptide--D-alanyl-D-alanine ligase